MDLGQVLSIGAAAGAWALVLKMYTPSPKWRPLSYTLAMLLTLLAILVQAVQHLGSALIQLYGRENMHDGYRDENFEAGLMELNIWPRKLQ